MNKMLIVILGLATFAFLGCAGNNVTKEEVTKEKVTKAVKKEVSESEKKYIIVVQKSINDCKEHGIMLNEERTNDFMRRSPQATIDKTAVDTRKMPKKLCQFFEEETSLEKIEKINEFTSKIMNTCQKLGVTLAKEKIHDKITNLPFFVIKKALAMENKTTVQECEFMKKKYSKD